MTDPILVDDAMRTLHAGLVARELPETVARQIARHPVAAADREVAKRLSARTGARERTTSMSEDWFKPVGLDHKIRVAQALFDDEIATSNDPRAVIDPKEEDPRRIALFIAYLSERIGKRPGPSSFLHERPDRETRRRLTGLGNGAYNKRFRLLNRMSDHLARYRRERRFLEFRLVGKAGLVADVDYAEFSREPWSAFFVAYYAARKRRRSRFGYESQSRPFDDLCALLLERAGENGANWFLIARVFPDADVLAHLDDAERGRLLGGWMAVLRDVAEELRTISATSKIDLDTMVVRRGNDSSRWNLGAQAWNTARVGWLATQDALGMERVLDVFMPGKVMRLMAGDVAWGHSWFGKGLHPDTRVWRELPRPWQVMMGERECGRAQVETACRKHGLDPVRSGWSAARVSKQVAAYEPTPELVHGVAVASPEVAAVLRRLGVFSGKP